jgi:hypothetical protein
MFLYRGDEFLILRLFHNELSAIVLPSDFLTWVLFCQMRTRRSVVVSLFHSRDIVGTFFLDREGTAKHVQVPPQQKPVPACMTCRLFVERFLVGIKSGVEGY